jgi:hypothetical protein
MLDSRFNANVCGDHIHDFSVNSDGKPEPIIGFDWDAVEDDDEPNEENDTVSFGDMSSALCVILAWICRSPHAVVRSSRACSLLLWLNPSLSEYSNFTAVATDHQVTKACVSAALQDLKKELQVRLPIGKKDGARSKYKAVQERLAKEGKHASDVRRRKKAAEQAS